MKASDMTRIENFTSDAKSGEFAADLSKEIVVAFLSNENNKASADQVINLFKGVQSSINEMLSTGSEVTVPEALPVTPAPVLEAAEASEPPVEKAPKRKPRRKVKKVSGRTGVHAKFAGIPLKPVIPVSDSVREDKLVCLIDGHEGKMLKRWLRSKYGMEYHEYIAFFGLPEDYPSVAPAYANAKSTHARSQGFGSTVTKTRRSERGLDPRKKGATAGSKQSLRSAQRHAQETVGQATV